MGKNLSDYPEVMTDRDVANLFDVNYRTIQTMARSQKLRGQQVGKKWFFHRTAIDNYLTLRTK